MSKPIRAWLHPLHWFECPYLVDEAAVEKIVCPTMRRLFRQQLRWYADRELRKEVKRRIGNRNPRGYYVVYNHNEDYSYRFHTTTYFPNARIYEVEVIPDG